MFRGYRGASVAISAPVTTLDAINAQVQLTAEARDAGNSPISGVLFQWSSDNEAVAIVDGTGLVTAVSNGIANIWANAPGGAQAVQPITVQQVTASVSVSPTGATVSLVGTTTQFTRTALDANGNPIPNPPTTWLSSHTQVGTISGTGLATAVRDGQTTISAQVDGLVGYALLTVTVPGEPPVHSWSAMASPTANFIYDVWGSSPTNVFASGQGGTILLYDGTSWTTQTTGVTSWMWGLWGFAPDDAYAVGTGGTVLQWNGSVWSQMAGTGSTSLFAVWGSSPDDILAAGSLGHMQRYDGSSWTTETSPATGDLYDVWGTAGDDVFVVGRTAQILHWDGGSWTTQSNPATGSLWSVWGTASDNVFAVGDGGEILRYNGSTWSTMSSPTAATLREVWGPSDNDIYAVGDGGVVVRYNGSTWNLMDNPVGQTMRGLWGTFGGELYAGGIGGAIMRGSRAPGALYLIRQSDDWLRKLLPKAPFPTTDIGPLGVGYAFGDCAWNPADGTMYMVEGRTTNTLYRVDLTTGAATAIGTHGILDMFGLGYHPPTNTVYGSAGGNLYSLNLTNGAATFIGAHGAPTLNGLVWDWTRDQFVGLTANVGGAQLYTVNVSTGAATPLAATPGIDNNGLTYDPVIDRFWAADYQGRLFQYDPTAGYAASQLASGLGQHTCIAYVP
jgi:hypothetical protein